MDPVTAEGADGSSAVPVKGGEDGRPLRRGWTTGACAAAAARAAWTALISGRFPDPVAITLPRGQSVCFALALEQQGADWAEAGIVKDAGDDPDVTHGALVRARVAIGAAGTGIGFRAGPGVGTVTRPGLPVAVGEPAINPVPRKMIEAALRQPVPGHEGCAGRAVDAVVTIGVDGGETLAERTWNLRLGIVGGLSILGTTGIVVPYSCAAWIHAIQRGVDVARAAGLRRIAAATGKTSEQAARRHLGLPDHAMIDMGDFAGGLFKYLRRHPVPHLTVAGGFAKMAKLGQGLLDLHSSRGAVALDWLAAQTHEAGGAPGLVAAVAGAGTALEALTLAEQAGVPLGDQVAAAAAETALRTLGSDVAVQVATLVVDRAGRIVGAYPGASSQTDG